MRASSATLDPIPFSSDVLTVRIGVTGHRTLPDPDRIRRSIRAVLADLDRRLGTTVHHYRAVSPLAEGADRLVAECVLRWTGGPESMLVSPQRLTAVLPMRKEAYFETFDKRHRADSIREFESLWILADERKVLPEAPSRHEAYAAVGRHVVGNCDVLIAVWDGRGAHGKGGTAEIVRFAQSNYRTVFWIHATTGRVRLLTSGNDFVSQLDFLAEYNAEAPGEPEVPVEARRRLDGLEAHARAAELTLSALRPLERALLPQFVKASRLAKRYQNRYYRTTYWAYALSAVAVGIAAVGGFVHRDDPLLAWVAAVPVLRATTLRPWVFLLEALVLVLLGVLWPGRFRAWQRKWVNYRYLAERLRASCFLYVAGLSESTSQPPADLRLSWLPDSWVANVIRQVWKTLPRHPALAGEDGERPVEEPAVVRFLRRAWIDVQRDYYAQASDQNRHSHERLQRMVEVMVGATLLAAVAHFALPVRWPTTPHWILDLLSVAAVTFPATASAVAGIDVFMHHDRNYERYASMSRHLAEIGEQMAGGHPVPPPEPRIAHLSPMQKFIRDIDETMAHEHQGWRGVIGVRLLGPS